MPISKIKGSAINDDAINTDRIADGAVTLDKTDSLFVNTEISGTEGARMPQGTTAQRASAHSGDIRFNTTLSLMEYYDGVQWKAIDSPPVVSSISPTTEADANANITITGSNFQSGATVKFVGNDGTEYNSPSVTFNSATEIVATTPASSLAVANEPYDIQVTNPSGLAGTGSDLLDAGGAPSWTTASGNIATLSMAGIAVNGNMTDLAATDPDGQSVTFALASGETLTPGLTLASDGSFTGTPTGTYSSGSTSVTDTFEVEASDGTNTTPRTFNIVRKWYDGSSSALAAASPYAIAQTTGTTPSTGQYWISNSGVNSGTAQQLFCDWSLDSTYGHIILTGMIRTDASINDYNYFGTNATGNAGTKGVNSDFYSPSSTILSGWSGDSRSRFIVGMTQRNSSSSISAAGSPHWFELSVTPSYAQGMFDNQPGIGAFTGTVTRSSGLGETDQDFYYTTSHGDSIWQLVKATSSTVNANMWMEMRVGGSDGNHAASVWGSGDGTYYAGNGHYTNRWLFMGFSPNNLS